MALCRTVWYDSQSLRDELLGERGRRQPIQFVNDDSDVTQRRARIGYAERSNLVKHGRRDDVLRVVEVSAADGRPGDARHFLCGRHPEGLAKYGAKRLRHAQRKLITRGRANFFF